MINAVTFDIRNLNEFIDTSYEFCEKLFKDLTTKIDCEKDLSFSTSMYFHRHLSPSPDEAVIEARRKSLSSYIESNQCLQSKLAVDCLSLIDCETEGQSLFSVGRTSSIILDDEPVLQNDEDTHQLSQDLVEALSSFYILPNGTGHYALHIRPFLRSVSLDVFSLSPFDFGSICDVVALSFGVDRNSNVKVFSSIRDF